MIFLLIMIKCVGTCVCKTYICIYFYFFAVYMGRGLCFLLLKLAPAPADFFVFKYF